MDMYAVTWIAEISLVTILIAWPVSMHKRFLIPRDSAEPTLSRAVVTMKKPYRIDQPLEAVRSYATFEKEALERAMQIMGDSGSAGAKGIDREVEF